MDDCYFLSYFINEIHLSVLSYYYYHIIKKSSDLVWCMVCFEAAQFQ